MVTKNTKPKRDLQGSLFFCPDFLEDSQEDFLPEHLTNQGKHMSADNRSTHTDGRFEGQSIYDTFWKDYELVTGTTVAPDNKYGFFSCSC